MNLSRPRESSSFYESFSDLIFTTMAIFVFLMILFLTQVRPAGVPQEEIDKVKAELAQAKTSAEKASQQIQKLQQKLDQESQTRSQMQDELSKTKEALKDAIATREIELVIVVDTSGSMGQAINGQKDGEPHVPGTGLKDAILDLADTLPELSSGFHVGVIGYRESLYTFPLQQIHAPYRDSGRSRQALDAFMQSPQMQPTSGAADLTSAVAEAIRWLSATNQPNARKVLVVIGDIGPYERTPFGNLIQERDSTALEREGEIAQRVKQFTNSFPASSLLMLFAQPTQAPLQFDTITFFRRLAMSVPDKRGRYTQDTAAMLGHIALAILAGEKRK